MFPFSPHEGNLSTIQTLSKTCELSIWIQCVYTVKVSIIVANELQMSCMWFYYKVRTELAKPEFIRNGIKKSF